MIIIQCANCKVNNWIKRPESKRNKTIPEDMDLECGNCGATYCAKNREYRWVDRPVDLKLKNNQSKYDWK